VSLNILKRYRGNCVVLTSFYLLQRKQIT